MPTYDEATEGGRFKTRSTTIGSGMPNPSEFLLFDPDQPEKDPNQLVAEQGGLTDPNKIDWFCPGCDRPMSWEIFNAHGRACYIKWRKVAAGFRRHRSFQGATLDIPPKPKLLTPENVR